MSRTCLSVNELFQPTIKSLISLQDYFSFAYVREPMDYVEGIGEGVLYVGYVELAVNLNYFFHQWSRRYYYL